MDTVIVGVESSERAFDALALARQLADPSARLVLVCAYPADPVVTGDGGARYARALRADAEATLARVCDSASIETLAIANPHPSRALARMALDRSATLIVVGSTHTGPLRRVVPGSTGERLLACSPCPVAIAPQRYSKRTQPIALVTCAFDATPDARRALQHAAQLAERLSARLLVIRVVKASNPIQATLATDPAAAAALRRILDYDTAQAHQAVAELDASLDAEAIVVRGNAFDELRRATWATDLAVIGSRGYGPLHGALSGSLSGRLIREAGCPLLLVPPTARGHAAARGRSQAAVEVSAAVKQ
jgi:nucleotide-binding universal stress UspA family protein